VNDPLFTIQEVMAYCKISRSKIYELIKTGHLRTIKIGTLRRVPESALQEMLADLT